MSVNAPTCGKAVALDRRQSAEFRGSDAVNLGRGNQLHP